MSAGPTPAREPGLRERKKAETRQRISDLATLMFIERGFDTVRVADIAAEAGVSEKTVYNYFPTKESLVFDQADEHLAHVLAAVTDRPAGVTPGRAYVDSIQTQLVMPDESDFQHARDLVPRFGRMLENAPTLRAAWGDHRHRLVEALSAALAADLGVGATEPEPRTAARALVSLTELAYDSMARNIEQARDAADMRRLMSDDLERGLALLDSGMPSLGLGGAKSDKRRPPGDGRG